MSNNSIYDNMTLSQYVYCLYIEHNLDVSKCSIVSGIGYEKFNGLLKRFGIIKDGKSAKECRSLSAKMRDARLYCELGKIVKIDGSFLLFPKASELFPDLFLPIKESNDKKIIDEFPRETILSLYIERNLTQKQCADELGIGLEKFKRILKVHNIVKSGDRFLECKSLIAKGKDTTVVDGFPIKKKTLDMCLRMLFTTYISTRI